VSGTGTVASDLENPDGSDPIAFSFIRDATAYNISLIFADGGLDTGNSASNGVGTTLGYYIDNVFTPIYNVGMTTGPTGTQAFDPAALGGNYGLYATVCYTAVGGVCTSSELYTSGIGNFGTNTQGAGWNHFALFQLTSGAYVIGFTAQNTFSGEGLGDFQDAVIEISAATTPEPSTLGFIGLGLAGLGILGRRRLAKK
jgi:hypothetical protein